MFNNKTIFYNSKSNISAFSWKFRLTERSESFYNAEKICFYNAWEANQNFKSNRKFTNSNKIEID